MINQQQNPLQLIHQLLMQSGGASPNVQPAAPDMTLPNQQGAQQGGGMLGGSLFSNGVAQVTGLPWLAQGSNGSALSALANMFKM
jgi:hypothetical protein